MGQVSDGADIVHRAQHIRHMGHCDQPGPRPDQRRKRRHVQRPVIQHGCPFEHRAEALTQHVPGHDIGVMLHLGDDDLVARPDRLAETRRHQIDRLGPTLGPDDLIRAFGIQEPRHGLARRLEGLGRLIGQGVQAAVDVGVGVLHRRRQGVDHRPRLLRRGGRVQIDERPAVHRPRQDRELGARGAGIKGGHSSPTGGGGPSEGWWRGVEASPEQTPLHRFAVPLPRWGRNGQSLASSHSRTTSLAPSCSIRSTTSVRKACVSRARASSAGMPRCCM